jgi:hypothetical protein
MGILLFAWFLGCIVNVGLWVLAIWDKPEFTVADVLLGLNFLIFSWFGWVVLAFCNDLDWFDSIIIYRKK